MKGFFQSLRLGRRRATDMLRKPAAGTLAILFGLVSLVTPFLWRQESVSIVGFLLMLTGALQAFYSFRRLSDIERQSEAARGRLTLLAGLLIFCVPAMISIGAVLVISVSLAARAVQTMASQIRQLGKGPLRKSALIESLVSLCLAIAFLLIRDLSAPVMIGLGAAYWQFSTSWQLWSLSNRDVVAASEDFRLPRDPRLNQLARTLAEHETRRRPVDRAWILTMLLILFAIHAGRMQTDWDLVGLLSPGVALLGDVLMALVIAFVFVIPTRLGLRRLTRPVEPFLWHRALSQKDGDRMPVRLKKALEYLLRHRLVFPIRLRQARYSFSGAFERGLQIGLPVVSIIVATTPIWGVSWYFDTENWAAGVWNSWAETRTMTWRESMVDAVTDAFPSRGNFRVAPQAFDNGGDFSFIVIGDTGEGDASQLVLKHQLVLAGHATDVKFLVLSSDVIYPSGEMKDYESKFFLPFAGFDKPIYAIPGNHDWYDALEGFAATFFRPDAARVAMRARVEVDRRMTTTRESRIESLLETAARLRAEYGVSTGYQDAPYFRFETADFCLFAVDTGIAKRVDASQFEWLERGLASAGNRFKMVILGHPLYAGGVYQAAANEEFASIHSLLHKYSVNLVMAGDTHDFEYYRESLETGRHVHHFVNGGGGAYLSLGTSLGWPSSPATASWAFYPTRAAILGKLDQLTPFWKRPLLFWLKHFRAWPFSPESLSALFDYNFAPFFQSFTVIRVEPSRNQVRVIPYGVRGQLSQRDLATSEDLRTGEEGQLAEFVFPLSP